MPATNGDPCGMPRGCSTPSRSATQAQRNHGGNGFAVFTRAQSHNRIASRAALKPASKKLVLIRSRKCRSLSPSKDALERATVTSSASARARAAQRMPRRQTDSTCALALAGRATSQQIGDAAQQQGLKGEICRTQQRAQKIDIPQQPDQVIISIAFDAIPHRAAKQNFPWRGPRNADTLAASLRLRSG